MCLNALGQTPEGHKFYKDVFVWFKSTAEAKRCDWTGLDLTSIRPFDKEGYVLKEIEWLATAKGIDRQDSRIHLAL